ncbi:mechanosensitive ion channel family protein [Persicobacter diffluens]|uniref:Mechanosensitive ion channel family protein n=1 Tax=Persicobacter diffluens TaxID=981 RepID=A0AAN5ALC2_9BACT|nr:hypothetical protein PEDI_43270 [Persicobacter diffluens]
MLPRLFLLLLLFLNSIAGQAQLLDQAPESGLKSPRACISTHLYYLQDEHFSRDSSAVALAPIEGMSLKKRGKRAIQLKQIYDGLGVYFSIRKIPDHPEYFEDSTTRDHIYHVSKEYPQIYLERINGQWVYSKETVYAIPGIHQQVYPYGMDRLLNLLQGLGDNKLFGLYYWQWIAIIALFLIGVLFYRFMIFITDRVLVVLFRKLKLYKTIDAFILPMARPFSWFMVMTMLRIMLPILQLPARFQSLLMIALKIMQPLFLVIVIYRIVDLLGDYFAHLASKTESTLDDQLVPLMRRFMKVIVVIVGILFVLQNLDYDITTLLAGISIGGLAFALAAQDTIKNLFGSLMIFVDRPFQIGDWVTGSGFDGTVEEVGFRSTRIRTFHNSVTTIPNGQIADMTVDNMGMRSFRRYRTMISVTYDTSAEAMEVFVEGLRKIVQVHPDTRKDYYHVYFNAYGAHSLDILFYIFFKVPDWGEELRARHEINLEIIKLAEHLGIRMAFPTTTIHVEDFPGQPSLTPAPEAKIALEERMSSFFNPKKGH